MQLKNILSLLPLIAITAASPRTSLPSSSDVSSDDNTPKCPDYCAGTAYNESLSQTYVCGDFRLGPRTLPTGIELGDLVHDYKRFGELCPGQFLDKWYNPDAASYIYPPQAGFQFNTDGSPIEGTITLSVGVQVDRFGSEYGTYTSPRDAPYIQRSLPPSNLDTLQSSPVYVHYFPKSEQALMWIDLGILTTTMFIRSPNHSMFFRVLSLLGLNSPVKGSSTRCRQML